MIGSTNCTLIIAATLTFNSDTTTGDSYYIIGQPLTVTCKNSSIPAAGFYRFGISFNNAASNVLCARSFESLEWGEPQDAALPDGIEYRGDC